MSELWATERHTESTSARIGELISRFAARLSASGVRSLLDASPDDCDGFMWAPTRRGQQPSIHTVHLRRTAIRNVYRLLRDLDPTVIDPSLAVQLPDKRDDRTRPLTDREIDLVRIAALGRARQATRAALAVAVCETTATTSELATLCWHHIDLAAARIQLPGAHPVRSRTGTLSAWGQALLESNAPASHSDASDELSVVSSSATDHHTRQAAMSNLLARVIRDAGITDPCCKPGSIRLWGARRHLSTGIEAVAVALGVDSLDVAALAIGHDWRHLR